MKHLALVILLSGLTGPVALAAEPCPNGERYAAYPEEMAVAPAQRPDSAVERARAAVAAGQDLNVVLAASAAGPAYDEHPYLNGGHFGPEGSATGCE